ncbi:MAG: family 16 glycoside hydrolase, partial [Bdellovibrionota bacterium]
MLVFTSLVHAAPVKVDLSAIESKWKSGSYADQGNPKWIVRDDEKRGKILSQVGSGPYLWIVNEEVEFRDGVIEAEFRIDEGKEDPEAGIIWRFQDKNNYYYVRANAIEDNVVFYRMQNGKKELLKESEAKSPLKTWHKLRVEANGNEVKVLIDDRLAITTKDKTFSAPGRIG